MRLRTAAWAAAMPVLDADDDLVSTEVAVGRLGKPATTVVSVPAADGSVRTMAAGDVAIVFIDLWPRTAVDIHDALDGKRIGHIDPDGWVDPGQVAVDVDNRLLYLPVRRSEGGIDIRRFALDGSDGESFVTLDERFAPEGIPTDHFGVVVDDGQVIVEACADDACRVWRAAADQPAGRPMRLPRGTPELCNLIGATAAWLVTSDEDVCYADVDRAPMPWRQTSLIDGGSHLISDAPQVSIGRVMVVDGRTLAIAAHRSRDWTRTDIRAYDLEGGGYETIVDGLDNHTGGEHEAWLRVSDQLLPVPWVLIEPWGDSTAMSETPSRLLNVLTGEVIELPLGTAGWR